jgi:hypothetical protein
MLFFYIFLPKKWAFRLKTGSFLQKFDHNIGFQQNANYFSENWRNRNESTMNIQLPILLLKIVLSPRQKT